MIDLDTGENIKTLYRFVEIRGGKRTEKFKTPDIKRALKFHKWYVARYKEGLLLEILPEKKVYDWKEKKENFFEKGLAIPAGLCYYT